MEEKKTNDATPTPEHEKEKDVRGAAERQDAEPDLMNSSGHVQEIDRTFSITSICFMSILTDNVSPKLQTIAEWMN